MLRQPVTVSLLSFYLALNLAQNAAVTAPRFDPQSAYDQAIHPFDSVRRAPQNWSETELSALRRMIDTAKHDCIAHSAAEFNGTALLTYARLCTLGEDWKRVQDAAARFNSMVTLPADIGKSSSARDIATAYDYEIQASLRLNEEEQAFRSTEGMLRLLPYDNLAAEASTNVVRYTYLLHTEWAMTILSDRQPMLLALIKAYTSESQAPPDVTPNMSLPDLYSQAILLPTMQQFNNQPNQAAASYTELEASLPQMLSANEQRSIQPIRRRYLLLGSHIPHIDTYAWLPDLAAVGTPPAINLDKGNATVLLLFPDWCNQCLSLHPEFSTVSRRLIADDVRFFALLAQASPPPKVGPKDVTKTLSKHGHLPETDLDTLNKSEAGGSNSPHNQLDLQIIPTAANLLKGTVTFVVPNHTLDDFSATDYPLIVVADHNGIVRSMEVATDNALVPGGLVDQLAAHVVALWPPPKP
jgi:hypothetical protein